MKLKDFGLIIVTIIYYIRKSLNLSMNHSIKKIFQAIDENL